MLVSLLLSAAPCFQLGTSAAHPATPRLAASVVTQTAVSMTDSASPTLSTLESWTREYYQAARDERVRGGKSMDEFLAQYDWFSTDYVLTGPDVGPLCKRDYLATQRGFTLSFAEATPDLDYMLDGFHLDPDNPLRVWFALRYVGTHTGATRIGSFALEPRGRTIRGGPEMHSILWTAEKTIQWETVGYNGCKYTGTNEGYGGLAGLLLPLGVPKLVFDTLSATGLSRLLPFLSQFNEYSDQGGRARSPPDDLPRWWNERTTPQA